MDDDHALAYARARLSDVQRSLAFGIPRTPREASDLASAWDALNAIENAGRVPGRDAFELLLKTSRPAVTRTRGRT